VRTAVYFKTLTQEEIEFYVTNYKPYDKAGAYGAQDWIGLVAVEKLEGSYFNVMGLPVKELYEHLKDF
jgi:septum formation protein